MTFALTSSPLSTEMDYRFADKLIAYTVNSGIETRDPG